MSETKAKSLRKWSRGSLGALLLMFPCSLGKSTLSVTKSKRRGSPLETFSIDLLADDTACRSFCHCACECKREPARIGWPEKASAHLEEGDVELARNLGRRRDFVVPAHVRRGEVFCCKSVSTGQASTATAIVDLKVGVLTHQVPSVTRRPPPSTTTSSSVWMPSPCT